MKMTTMWLVGKIDAKKNLTPASSIILGAGVGVCNFLDFSNAVA